MAKKFAELRAAMPAESRTRSYAKALTMLNQMLSREEERLKEPNIQITKYRDSRFFAIYLNGELLAVTVYKKGAVAIREALMRR